MIFLFSISCGRYIKSPIDDIIYVALGGSEDYETAGVASVSYYNDNLSINWVANNSSFDILHGIDVSSDGQRIYASGRGDGNICLLYTSDAADE